MWLERLQNVPLFQENWQTFKHLEPTVTEWLLSIGVSVGLSQALQIAAMLGAASCLWLMFRGASSSQAAPRPLDVAALQVAAFLATPYAFVYDMPMVTSAVATTIEQGMQSGRPWRSGEAALLVAALVLPIALFSGIFDGWPVGPVILALLLALIMRIGWSIPAHPPIRT